jgi:phage tail-like protein
MPVLGGYQIKVEFNGAIGTFSKISGIRAQTNVLESKGSSSNGAPYSEKLPGSYSSTPVTFQAGYMIQLQSGGPWWTNVEHIQNGTIDSVRGTCMITFMDTNQKPVLFVYLENAWPSKWSASDLAVQKNVAWMETIVFQCESVKFSWDISS